jgi:TRAP transporter 4TM/12TM fusion protein
MSEGVSGGQQAAQDAEAREQIRKYDRESAHRTQLGRWGWAVLILGSALTLFQLYTGFRGAYGALIQGSIHLGTGLGLIFLLYPAKKTLSDRPGVPWYDAVLALVAIGVNYYIVFNYEYLINEAVIFGFNTVDVAVATLGVLLLLEATRRCVGVPIVIIGVAALVYGLLGPYIPVFGHAGFSWPQLSTELFFTRSAIFGTPIQVSSTFIFLFLFFGVVLTKTNIGQFFTDLAFGATGRFTGGTAKAAVAASGLQGMVSGSSVANTVTSGSFTIPMMRRAGFRPEFAAATEASASTGGQIMPPLMGAAAFIMAEYTGISYNEIIVIAIIPALLYFSGVFFGTHFEAKRVGIVGLPRDQLPRAQNLFKRIYLLLPLVVIIWLLFEGRTPTNAALWGIGTALAVSLIRAETRMSLGEAARLLENGARIALPVIAACATAGIVVGVVTKTGLGAIVAGGLTDLALGNLLLLMFYTMIACIILGMGLPTTANYVVTATVAAPALLEFGVPVIAAHMFVFYFGIVADITPPVCLAAYAGAGIARANPMRAGGNAVLLAIAAFIIPYMFVLNPVLVLEGATVGTLVPAIATALVGMGIISAGVMGYLVARAHPVERVLLVAAGIMLVHPDLRISLPGLGLALAVGAFQYLRSRRADRSPSEDTGEETGQEQSETTV